jgi:hypothetical protein
VSSTRYLFSIKRVRAAFCYMFRLQSIHHAIFIDILIIYDSVMSRLHYILVSVSRSDGNAYKLMLLQAVNKALGLCSMRIQVGYIKSTDYQHKHISSTDALH